MTASEMRPQGCDLAEEQAAVCATLRARTRDNPCSTLEGIRLHGSGFQSRVGELKEKGWDLHSRRVGRHRGYWIVGDEPRLDPDECDAGCTLRLGTRDGWTSRTHADARRRRVVPAEVLEEAEAAALAAYQGVVEAHLREVREREAHEAREREAARRELYRDERGLLVDPTLDDLDEHLFDARYRVDLDALFGELSPW
jgi:hypothetical protein